jgi:hypothetical protein
MSLSLKKQKFLDKLSEPLNSKMRRVLETMGGDELIRNFIREHPTKAFTTLASLEPKNVTVKQEHRINFVKIPPKAEIPENVESNVIDVTPIS